MPDQLTTGMWAILPNPLAVEHLREELMRRKASPLFLQGIAQAVAIHLARNYAETVKESRSGSPSLPGYKLRQIAARPLLEVRNSYDLRPRILEGYAALGCFSIS